MKCDKLKAYKGDVYIPVYGSIADAQVYLKEDADKALAEKDKEIALLKERICNGDVSRITWIDDCIAKDKEIAELKAKVDELSFDKKLLEGHWKSEKITCESASRNCIELSDENAKLVSKIESLKVGHRQGIANIKFYYKQKLEDVNELVKESKELLKESQKMHQRCADNAIKKIRHQKYKRCLAMAKWCHNESLWWYSKGYGFEKYDKFWEKWQKRWLELAEKFKEAK